MAALKTEELVVKIPFFDALDAHRLKNLSHLFERSVYKQGQIIVKIGEKIDHFYIIAAGSVSFGAIDTKEILGEKKEKHPNAFKETETQVLTVSLRTCLLNF